jgi:hypothetical protein
MRDGRAGALGNLRRWAGQVEGRGGCRLPDGAVRLLRSALGVFADDIRRHLDGRRCAGGARPATLPMLASTPGGSPWR